MQLGPTARSVLLSVMIVSTALLACKKKKSTATESVSVGSPTPAPTRPPVVLPATPKQTFGLKQAAKLDGVTVTIDEYQDCRLDNFYSRRSLAKKKEKLVGINVTFEGNGEKDHVISYSGFKISDSEGLTFRATLRSGTKCSPTLKSGSLAKGDKSRGWVLFQVPEKSSGFKIVFNNRRPFRSGTPADEKEQKVTFQPEG
jgi:hypothetical protein